MKPTLGRIVLFSTDHPPVQLPAIVVAVHDDGSVNLRVFGDNGESPAYATRVREGTEPMTWMWPPRA